MTHKTCTKCQQLLPLEAFAKDAGHADGLRSNCRTCQAAALSRWREANRDRTIAYQRAKRAADPEKEKAYIRAWKLAHPERVSAADRARRDRLPDDYVRGLIGKHAPGIDSDQIPQALIDLKRSQLKLLRLIKEKTK